MLPRLLRVLYIQVLIAIFVGIWLGYSYPEFAVKLEFLGDGFIKLMKMLVGPIIFCTIVMGMAGMHDMKKVGVIGGKALIYFEVMSSLALLIGLLVANWLQPGSGFNVDPASLDPQSVAGYTTQAAHTSTIGFILGVIPNTMTEAFAQSNILQILFSALLVGSALSLLGERASRIYDLITDVANLFFTMVRLITKIAPLGALGAMAFTVGKYGVVSLTPLLKLIGCFYLSALLFVIIVLGCVARLVGFNIFRFIRYLKEELLIVLGTSSSEAALPQLMDKMQNLGCSRSVVGLVIPAGYSFNLDGTSIYMTIAIMFIAQALNIELTWMQQFNLLFIAMLTSKGASGVTGSGFITLAATLAVVPTLPVVGIVLILGVDRFMSECRSLTNLIGNGVGCIVAAAWARELDHKKLNAVLRS